MTPNNDRAKLSPSNRGDVSPKQTTPSTLDANVSEMRNDMIDGSLPSGKNEESFNSSSSSSLLAKQYHAYSCIDTTRNTEDDTEPQSVSFDLDSRDNYECIQHRLYRYRTTQRRQQPLARDATVSSASFLPPTTASPPKLCLGISDLVDDALTRVADVMFDGMRCGMDDTCHRWTYVPGEDSP